MVRSVLSRYFYGISIALLFLLSAMVMISPEEAKIAAKEPNRAQGPIVNRSTVTITLYEDFGEFSGEYFFGTGKGNLDIFYDPTYNWKEDDIQYPHKAFEVSYPWGYDKTTTPIEVKFVTSHYDTNFATATVTCQDSDFNSYIYGQDNFKVTVTGWNATGSSEAELWFEILNVNDAPTQISEKDFFSIQMDEDAFYDGVNKDNDQLDDIFGDNSDPDDTLTFDHYPQNELASEDNIVVDLESDGSSIIFTPVEDFSCPYIPTGDRLKGRNYRPGGGRTWSDFFAHFKFNCSDQDGDFVMGDLYVYVGPVNDVPIMELPSDHYVNEGVLVNIQFEAFDVDPENEQELRYGTNITTIMYEQTKIQLEFEEGYDFDTDDGLLQFNTENKMVGDYPVAAWVDDRPSKELGTKADYPTTPYKIYSNFTLHIVNKNDPPTARMDSPSGSYIYNTTWPIEFNATRTLDPDMIHGQELTYRWFSDGEMFGEGAVVHELFETEGIYYITLNVTDGEFYSNISRTISVEKTRILGEPFIGKQIDHEYNDNISDALVLHRSLDEMFMEFGGKDSIDVRSVFGFRDPLNDKVYKIKVTFGEKMSYLFTQEKKQEPVLTIYFLKPDFKEDRISPRETDIPSYTFPVPTSNYRYNKMEFDLRNVNVLYYPLLPEKQPGIRMLDTMMGVEITLTVVELDQMNVDPDFIIYATAEMKTTITETGGFTVIKSWDAAGYSAKVPQVDASISHDNGNVNSGIDPIFIILPLVLVLIAIIIAVILVFVVISKKGKKEEPEPMVMPVQQSQTVEEMVFGDAPPPSLTAEQLYGTTQEQAPGLPPTETPPEGLPPAQPEQPAQVTSGEVPPPTSAPAPQQPAAPAVPPQTPPVEQPPAVTLPDQ